MSTKPPPKQKATSTPPGAPLRASAEVRFAAELEALERGDDRPRPPGWRLSPQAVATYLLGGEATDGTAITPKYLGERRRIETAVGTLATDRALLLLGVPGTAKSWVSEHLAAAISGDAQLLVQCTAGTDENQLRYGWNYAQLLAHGPSEAALVATPMLRGMREGRLVRLEELTRMPSDVQDTLITVLSEKVLPIPELEMQIWAQPGFNVIATANSRDKGVNELSSALKRRFNVVVLPLPEDPKEEERIVEMRVSALGATLALPEVEPAPEAIARTVQMFRELREGRTVDGRVKLKTPSATLSTAEAIAALVGSWSDAAHFGSGTIDARALAPALLGSVVKDPVQDRVVLEEYMETVLKSRKGWSDIYRALRDLL
jgi:MoxR-like ATPase